MMQGGGGGSNLSCQLLLVQARRRRREAHDHDQALNSSIRLHHNDDDVDCDSNRANDADVDGDNGDGGRQQRQQMQQQHSSPASKTTCFATRVVRATVHDTCQNHSTRQQPNSAHSQSTSTSVSVLCQGEVLLKQRKLISALDEQCCKRGKKGSPPTQRTSDSWRDCQGLSRMAGCRLSTTRSALSKAYTNILSSASAVLQDPEKPCSCLKLCRVGRCIKPNVEGSHEIRQ